MLALTVRQTQILDFIKTYLVTYGYPPTRAEIAERLGFKSANAAEEHLKALARKGAIAMTPGVSRGIRIPETPTPEEVQGIPIIGKVAAGTPILATAHTEGYCAIAADFFHPKADYLLRVQGMSMQDAGILDGDLLAVHRCQEARNGQIVVARIHEEVTVKRFQKEGSIVSLLPENPDFESIRVNLLQEELVIEGIQVGIIRHSR